MSLSKIQRFIMLSIGLLAGFLIFAASPKAEAGISICNNGMIHHSPGMDYACMGADDGGLQSSLDAGDLCPPSDEFERASQEIPEGETGDWCDPNDPDGSVTEGIEAPYYVQSDCQDTDNLNEGNCGIIKYLVMTINFLSAIVGVVVTASIIIGGIQYSTAGSDPQKVQSAKNRIRNAIIALLFFIFGYALLNFLVPGGVL